MSFPFSKLVPGATWINSTGIRFPVRFSDMAILVANGWIKPGLRWSTTTAGHLIVQPADSDFLYLFTAGEAIVRFNPITGTNRYSWTHLPRFLIKEAAEDHSHTPKAQGWLLMGPYTIEQRPDKSWVANNRTEVWAFPNAASAAEVRGALAELNAGWEEWSPAAIQAELQAS